MAIFSAIAAGISAALFAGSALATSLISSALAFGAQLAVSYLNRPKEQKYTAVQGEVQFGANVPAGAMFGTGKVVGHRIYYAKWGPGNKVNADVFILSNGWCDGLEPYVYFYGEKHDLVTRAIIGNETAHYGIADFNDAVSIRFYDGRPGQGVDAKLVADTDDLSKTWKSTSVCAGHAYVVVERTYNAKLFPKGRPDFEWVLRGLRLYDPRKDSTVAGGSGAQRLATPSTWAFSKNPALQRFNYQIGFKGLVSGRTVIGEGKSIGQIDLGTYFAAMNVCDTVREGKKTYESAMYVDSSMDHTEILKEFDDAMAGYGLNRRGLSGVIPGAPQIPVLDIASSDIPLDRAQQVQRRKSAFDLYNYLSGQFTSIESNWAEESLKPVYVNADIAVDGRPRQTANDFLQVTDPDIAQYLLNIRYRQNRHGGTATVPVSRRVGLAVSEGEWVTFQGVTWLITEWQADEQFRFTLVLAETSADIYDDGDIEPGPIVIPPTPPINPSLISTIAGFDVEAGLVVGASGSQVPCLRFTWTPPQDPTITAVQFFYTAAGDATVYEDQSIDPEKGSYVTTKNVASGKSYTARATITTVPDRFKTFTSWETTLTSTGNISVLDGSVTATKLADAAVTASKIANEAVTSLKLANLAVTEAKIAVDAVTRDVIKNGEIISSKIADAALIASKFPNDVRPIEIVSSLPSTGNFEGRQVFFGGKTYRYTSGAWTANVAAVDIAGQLASAQIADFAVTATKFASTLKPVEVLGALPSTGNVQGRQVFLTTDNKLYRYTGSAWTATVEATDISGTIVATTVADDSISTPKLQANAITTAKLAVGAVTAGTIAANAITTGKIQAGAVAADQIAANAITVQKMAIGDFDNLVANATFTDNFAGWAAYGGSGGGSVTQYVGPEGIGVRFKKGTGTEEIGLRLVNYSMTGDAYPGQKVRGGETLRIKLKVTRVAGAAASGNIGLFGQFNTTAGTFASNGLPGATTPSVAIGVTEELSTTYVVPSDRTGISFQIYYGNNAASANGEVLITDVVVMRMNTAELYVDGSITSASIATGAIVADKVATNAITAGKIAANAVTAGTIAAGAVSADKIQANSISAKQLVITDFSNLILDNTFVDATNWSVTTGVFTFVGLGDTYGAAGGRGARSNFAGVTAGAGTAYVGTCTTVDRLPVESGKEYTWGGKINPSAGATGFIRLTTYWFDVNGVQLADEWVSMDVSTTTSEMTYSKTFKAPALATSCTFAIRRYSATVAGGVGTGFVYVYNVFLRRSASAELIVDGSIIADKIAANAVTTAKINAGAVTATEIASNAVTAVKISANAVTAAKIAANTIAATHMVANAITAREMILQDFSNLFQDYDMVSQNDDMYSGLGASAADFTGSSSANRGKNVLRVYPNGAAARSVYTPWSSCEIDADYRLEGSVAQETASAGWTAGIYVQFGTVDATGAVTYTRQVGITASNSKSTTRKGVNITTASDERAWRLRFYVGPDAASRGYFSGPMLRRRQNANLIVDGSVIADKIATNAITADKINVTSLAAISATLGNVNISNAIIGTLTVGTSNIAANAVTASATMIGNSAGNPEDTTTLTGLMSGSPALISIAGDYSISAGSGGSGTFEIKVVNTTTGSTAYSFFRSYGSGNTSGTVDAFRIHSNTNAGTNTYTLVITSAPGLSVAIDVNILYWRR